MGGRGTRFPLAMPRTRKAAVGLSSDERMLSKMGFLGVGSGDLLALRGGMYSIRLYSGLGVLLANAGIADVDGLSSSSLSRACKPAMRRAQGTGVAHAATHGWAQVPGPVPAGVGRVCVRVWGCMCTARMDGGNPNRPSHATLHQHAPLAPQPHLVRCGQLRVGWQRGRRGRRRLRPGHPVGGRGWPCRQRRRRRPWRLGGRGGACGGPAVGCWCCCSRKGWLCGRLGNGCCCAGCRRRGTGRRLAAGCLVSRWRGHAWAGYVAVSLGRRRRRASAGRLRCALGLPGRERWLDQECGVGVAAGLRRTTG